MTTQTRIFGILSPEPHGEPPWVRAALNKAGACWPGGGFYSGENIGLRCSDRKTGFFENTGMNARIAYSGEIYNYHELRRELEAAGAKFRSGLESELILHAYRQWGAGCQERLNGSWAFSIWDGRKRRLFCSRDRFGLKPFYYSFNGSFFIFGSQIKTLFSCRPVKKEPDLGAVFNYLVHNRSEFSNETFFKGIKQLEAGCCLFISPGKEPEQKRYFSPAYNPEMGSFNGKALKRHSSEFLELLKSSVKARLGPPFPIGGALSGGLDSSAICRLADAFSGEKKSGPEKMKIFSIAWEGEAKYIKEAVGTAASSHCLIRPEEAGKISWAEVEKAALASEIPLTSTSQLGRILVENAAGRSGVQALLDGGGGDELLAGYPGRYFNAYLNQIICSGNITRFAKEFKTLYAGRLREFGIGRSMDPGFYKIFLKTQSSAPQLSEFFPDETVNRSFFPEHSPLWSPAPRLLLNLQQVLWGDTLALGKEYTPLGSIRYRFPFLDHRLAEYVFSLPACYKIHKGWTKYLLRTAMAGILPENVRWRKEKIGGMAPISVWKDFLGRNRGELSALLTGRKFYSGAFLNQKSIIKRFDALFKAAVAPDTTDISGLWRFANLELWLKENMH